MICTNCGDHENWLTLPHPHFVYFCLKCNAKVDTTDWKHRRPTMEELKAHHAQHSFERRDCDDCPVFAMSLWIYWEDGDTEPPVIAAWWDKPYPHEQFEGYRPGRWRPITVDCTPCAWPEVKHG